MKIQIILTTMMLIISTCGSMAFAGDHTLFYKGTLHITDLTGHAPAPPDQVFIMKKELSPSQSMIIETATLRDYTGRIADLKTSINVKGNTVYAQSSDGSAIGTGVIEGISASGDFSYLNINFVITSTGNSVKNINYITPTALLARKEIDSPEGVPTMLWESDMTLIQETEFRSLYQQLHQGR